MAMKSRPLTESEQIAQITLKRIWDEKARSLGLTQQSLADEWDCTQGYVGNMINGRSPITPVYAMMFAKALEVDARSIHPDIESLATSIGSDTWNDAEVEILVELYRAASASARRAAIFILYNDVDRDDDGGIIQDLLPDGVLLSDKGRKQHP